MPIILPKFRCPCCGKTIHAVKVDSVPPALKYEDCLRRCNKCKIGATNAKNFAKVKFICEDGTVLEQPGSRKAAAKPAQETAQPETPPQAAEPEPKPE